MEGTQRQSEFACLVGGEIFLRACRWQRDLPVLLEVFDGLFMSLINELLPSPVQSPPCVCVCVRASVLVNGTASPLCNFIFLTLLMSCDSPLNAQDPIKYAGVSAVGTVGGQRGGRGAPERRRLALGASGGGGGGRRGDVSYPKSFRVSTFVRPADDSVKQQRVDRVRPS